MSMKLYLRTGLTELYLGDACQMDFLPSGYVKLLLTDPPYGINYVSCHRKKKLPPITGDDHFPAELLQTVLSKSWRILADDSVLFIFCDWRNLHLLRPIVEEFYEIKNLLIWMKNNWSGGDLDENFSNQYEIILFAVKGKPQLYWRRRFSNILPFARVFHPVHPAEKPVDLLRFLIKITTLPGDVVLDPFAGSGTTLLAAASLGRKAIGFEIEEKWCRIAKAKLSQNIMPLDVDVEPKVISW